MTATTAPQQLAATLPLSSQIICFLKLWGLKLASSLGFAILRLLNPTPKELRPTAIKTYPCRPSLRNRIFVPRSRKPDTLLPLYIDLHGGGFALCDARFDDEFCAEFSNTFNILVVSIEYGRAPSNRFPGPTEDTVAIAMDILEDTSLPIDKERVVLGGFSCGGNLALSASQNPKLARKLTGIVSWYPVTDFTLNPKEKQQSRPYRNSKDVDALKDFGPVFDWGYIKSGQDLKDPELSVRYCGRKVTLPNWICIIGAQYDMLANEARETIFDIADLDEEERQLGKNGFEKDSYKWVLVDGVRHAFTHNIGDCKGHDELVRNNKRREMMEEVAKWLFSGPFCNDSTSMLNHRFKSRDVVHSAVKVQ
ncbi:Arylesterase 1 [Phlyctema vagabunda]|uniref:Arylesterase 1 n=1 Tax=Phlyctema vagabunda TaxID=108571 RepID=A0ABR4PXQ5_9HELO